MSETPIIQGMESELLITQGYSSADSVVWPREALTITLLREPFTIQLLRDDLIVTRLREALTIRLG